MLDMKTSFLNGPAMSKVSESMVSSSISGLHGNILDELNEKPGDVVGLLFAFILTYPSGTHKDLTEEC